MTMKQGFSLLELVVGIAISAIVTTLLYSIFSTIIQWSDYGAVTIDTDIRTAVFLHQFQKDVTGMFLPVQAIAENKAEQEDSKEKKDKPKLLERACYSENKGSILSLFTFISNNPTRLSTTGQSSSSDKKSIAGYPYISRITYTVEQMAKGKDSYTIKRQESPQLEVPTDQAKQKDTIRGYEIIDNVKAISLSFMRPKSTSEPKKTEPNTQKKNPTESVEYESFSTWPPPKETMIDLPHMISMNLTIWNEQQNTERSVLVHIPAFVLSQLYPLEEEEDTTKPIEPTPEDVPRNNTSPTIPTVIQILSPEKPNLPGDPNQPSTGEVR
jgi:prepilin-type N-terminal cleavage/methylation domain-containing protein